MFYSKDLKQTETWYKEKLGFESNYFAPGEFLSMSHEQMGRFDFHNTDDAMNIGRGPLPYFMVQDIEKVAAWLKSKNIQVDDIQQVSESPKHTWFYDNSGNIIGLEEI